MLNLLNAITPNDAAFWMIVALGVLLIMELAIFAVLFVRGRNRQSADRRLVSITLETEMVKREFLLGEKFDADGIIVTAHYNLEPFSQRITKFDVTPPEMTEPGKFLVTVTFEGMSAVYAISIVDPNAHEEVPAPIIEEVLVPVPTLPDRMITDITLDATEVRREFKRGEQVDASGLIVTAHYNVEPYAEKITEFTVIPPDMTVPGKALVTIAFEGMRATYAITIVEPVMEKVIILPNDPVPTILVPPRKFIGITLDTTAVQREFTVGDEFNSNGLIVTAHYDGEPFTETVMDYEVLPVDMNQIGNPVVLVNYEGKRVGYQLTINPAAVERQPVSFVVEEESAEAGTLRYDRSFTARLIQSDDELKQWYTELKNALLGFKKSKARMSWKRESFRIGRETLAKLSFRGKTLCIFLPLNPADFVDTKYKVEDVSKKVDDPSKPVSVEEPATPAQQDDTPCMYRIKNARRVKYAIELIEMAAAKYDTPRIERESEDFYVPYEGILELINKGLIKRNIKTKADEVIFRVANAERDTKKEVAVATETEGK